MQTLPHHDLPTAAERVFAYLDLRASLITGPPAEFTCLAGTMVQESFATSDSVRAACADSIFQHASTLEADLAAALADAGSTVPGGAPALARHTQAVLQGAFILAKASGDPAMVLESIALLRSHLELVFRSERSRASP